MNVAGHGTDIRASRLEPNGSRATQAPPREWPDYENGLIRVRTERIDAENEFQAGLVPSPARAGQRLKTDCRAALADFRNWLIREAA